MAQRRVTLYNCESTIQARNSFSGEMLEGPLAAVLQSVSVDLGAFSPSTWVLTYLPVAEDR